MDKPDFESLDFEQLAQEILHRRRVCRPRGVSISPTWQLIMDDARCILVSKLQRLTQPDSLVVPLDLEQKEQLLGEMFKDVLGRDRLQSLTIEVQQTTPKTPERQIRLTDLIGAIQLSGHLSYPKGLSKAEYADAVNQLFGYVAKNIDAYSAEKGDFVKWLNFRLDKIPHDMYREAEKPVNRRIKDLIRRNRYALQHLAKEVNPSLVWAWIKAIYKHLIPDCRYTWDMLFLLSLVLHLAIANNKGEWSKAASLILDIPIVGVFAVGEDNINAIADLTDRSPSRADQLRQCLQKDRTGAYTAKHVRGHPEASFKAIALAHLDGLKWEEIAQSLWRLREDAQKGTGWSDEQYRGSVEERQPISVGTLSTFYQRSLTKFRPILADCINEEN